MPEKCLEADSWLRIAGLVKNVISFTYTLFLWGDVWPALPKALEQFQGSYLCNSKAFSNSFDRCYLIPSYSAKISIHPSQKLPLSRVMYMFLTIWTLHKYYIGKNFIFSLQFFSASSIMPAQIR